MPLIYNLDMVLTMQELLASETHKADEAKQAQRSALVHNEELSKKLEEAGRKIDELQDSVQRFFSFAKLRSMMHLFLLIASAISLYFVCTVSG